MKKYLAVAVLSAFVVHANAVQAIFKEFFAPNTSNDSWVSCFMNQTPVPQNGGPMSFPTGNTVLTISIDASACPSTDSNPVGFEYEAYSINGGKSWVIMEETWTVIYMPYFTTTAAQIDTIQGLSFDIGPMTEQVSCPKQ